MREYLIHYEVVLRDKERLSIEFCGWLLSDVCWGKRKLINSFLKLI